MHTESAAPSLKAKTKLTASLGTTTISLVPQRDVSVGTAARCRGAFHIPTYALLPSPKQSTVSATDWVASFVDQSHGTWPNAGSLVDTATTWKGKIRCLHAVQRDATLPLRRVGNGVRCSTLTQITTFSLQIPYWPPESPKLSELVMRRITTFRSTTYPIYDGGPIILYYNIRI